jgi:uncharacterized membrane protein YdbT with pleckstrin-like domain
LFPLNSYLSDPEDKILGLKIILSEFLFITIKTKGLRGDNMAKSHFSFKKRQKELARKKKQEEKRQRKLNKNTDISEETLNQSQEKSLDQPQDQSQDVKND